MSTFLIFCFWTCLAGAAYAYVGYPLTIYAAACLFGRRRATPAAADESLPTATLLIAAYNEADVIGERVENALRPDYPAGKLEILIATDGCDDGTNEIVSRYASRGVRLLPFTKRRGKSHVLNDAVPQATGEVLILSDANTMMEPDAARRLASWFSDQSVGSVTGQLKLVDAATGKNADGLYWRYENFLKRCEGELDAVPGANGAIYSVRRELFRPIPPDTMVDDLTIPLLAKLRTNCRNLFDSQAIAHEETAPDVSAEFKRRSRIGAGGFQALSRLWPLLNPRYGWTAFTFFAHKALRWVTPFLLVGLFFSNLLLAARPPYTGLFVAQIAFYLAAAIGRQVELRGAAGRVLRLAELFAAMNLALLIGFVRWARGPQNGAWIRTPRTA